MDHEHRGDPPPVGGPPPEPPAKQAPGVGPPGAAGPPPPSEKGSRGILIVQEFGKDEREVRIPGDQVEIGRDPDADVVLRDLGVSREHARIRKADERFYLEDLGSRNGTLVNRKRIPERGTQVLNNGDLIQVGRSVLRFLIDLSRKLTSSWKKQTRAPLTLGNEDGPGPAAKEKPALCLFRLKKIEAALITVVAGRTPTRFPLVSDRVRIGRDSSSDIVLEHPTVSPHHAEIVYNREGFHLVDRDSEAGTFLDGVDTPLSRLARGSFIRFGRIEALFSIREEGEEPSLTPFALRDHLFEVYPDRKETIQKAFRENRGRGVDLGEELVLGGVLSPGEWWAARAEFRKKPASGEIGWGARLLRGILEKKRGRPSGAPREDSGERGA